MSASHTPGPWRASEGTGYVAILSGPTIDTQVALTTTSTPEGVANARLMAAAPEMLAALDGVVTWARLYGLDVMPYRTGCATEQPDIARARAAIARARGEVSP